MRALVLSLWSLVAWAQPAVEAVQQLPARRSSDGPAPRVAAAWDDARVGDQATWRFKLSEVTGKVRAEVLSVGKTVIVGYEVTSESLRGPLGFRVGVDRVRSVPHAVDPEKPSAKAGAFSLADDSLPCEQVEVPNMGHAELSEGAGCRSAQMPYAMLDGWLEARGERWEVVLEAASRGTRGAKAVPSAAPMVLTPFSWAYQKESGGAEPEVGSYRQYSIRGFVVDAYLRFPMTCNLSSCSYVRAQPLGEFVASLIVAVSRERNAEPRRDTKVTDEEVTLNGRKLQVRTYRGMTSRGDVLMPYVASTVIDPLGPGLDGLMWRLRVPWISSGSPEDPRSAELLSWGTGTPAALPLVPMREPRKR